MARAATLRFSLQTLGDGRSVLDVVTVAVLAGAVVLLAVCALVREPPGRQPWPLLVYGALVVAMDVGSDGSTNSKIRQPLPAVPLPLPFARGPARRRRKMRRPHPTCCPQALARGCGDFATPRRICPLARSRFQNRLSSSSTRISRLPA